MDHVHIAVERQGDIPLVQLGGKVIGEAVPGFELSLREAIEEDTHLLILDLQGLEMLDSTGLGAVVGCYTTLRKRGGMLVLANVPPNILELLRTTRLINVFDVYEDSETALRAHRN